MKTYYVYIVNCSDNSFYTGITNNIERRIIEHNTSTNRKSYTFYRRPVALVWFQKFLDPNEAIAIEKQLKGWSRRKKKALINGKFDELVKLSRNNQSSTSSD